MDFYVDLPNVGSKIGRIFWKKLHFNVKMQIKLR